MQSRLVRQMAFLNEADQLKTITRANELLDGSRPENSAEHSWHLALWAMIFAPLAPKDVQIDRVILMLLLHDLVEIDAGDHPIHLATDWTAVAVAEQAAAERIFGLLPDDIGARFLRIWQEFEAAQTPEAIFAKHLDVVQPLIQVSAAASAPREHIAIARENMATGRASNLGTTWPDMQAHATALLNRQTPSPSPVNARLNFLTEADRLKTVYRATKILDGTRRENSGEHSWHIALFACVLAEHAKHPVNISRVVKMLLIHDLVEIDAGDTPIHGNHDVAEIEAVEQAAATRIFGLLPADQAVEFRALWDEFEAAQTDDAVFGKSIDRVQPVICNLETDGGTWPEYNVTAQQLEDRVGWKVAKGAPAVWDFLRVRIAAWFAAN